MLDLQVSAHRCPLFYGGNTGRVHGRESCRSSIEAASMTSSGSDDAVGSEESNVMNRCPNVSGVSQEDMSATDTPKKKVPKNVHRNIAFQYDE